MDDEAKEEIIKHMNPQRGFESELNRVLKNNDSLSKSPTWTEPTPDQFKSIRSRMTVERDKKGVKFQKRNKTYIRVDENNYKRVTREEDVFKTPDGRVYLRNERGSYDRIDQIK